MTNNGWLVESLTGGFSLGLISSSTGNLSKGWPMMLADGENDANEKGMVLKFLANDQQ